MQNIGLYLCKTKKVYMPSKRCHTCKEIKTYELFPKQHSVISGRGSQCKTCVSARNKRRYEAKKETILERVRKYREDNKPTLLLKYREYSKKQYLKNKPQRNAITRKYQASKINRTPAWLTKEHRAQMEKYYVEAARLSKELGAKYVVDHIVPLQGKTVSGLHVPWNLQILDNSANCRKQNKF